MNIFYEVDMESSPSKYRLTILSTYLIALVVGILVVSLIIYYTTEGLVFNPPHVRVTRTGLKYYNKPYSHNFRQQMNVNIEPPANMRLKQPYAVWPGMGLPPVVMQPPPSQAQVNRYPGGKSLAYPAGSGAVVAPGSQGESVSVKLGEKLEEAKGDSNNMQDGINGSKDEVESYM